MPYDDNAFCWNGIVSTDEAAARRFYAATIGWHAVDHQFPNGDRAVMLVAGEVPRAHLRAPQHEKEPCAWTSYLRVEDVDGSSRAAESNGGTVMAPPTDIPPGRFSVVSTPSGAVLCLYHEADEDAAGNAPAGPGSRHWTELHSEAVEADLGWLEATFGFEIDEVPIPEGGSYYILNAGGQPRGGICRAVNDSVAGSWLNWIEVPDVDEALRQAEATGGRSLGEPSDWPGVGRMAMLRDPTDGVFGVIAPE